MHNIGNDIVDLDLAKTQSDWQRKGFLEKQFTIKEQKEICSSKNPFLKVWLFWSMKEAAYKCYTQKYQKRFFAPQKFECQLISEKKGIVFFEEAKFYTTTDVNAFYICTIAEGVKQERRILASICSSNKIDSIIKQQLYLETRILPKEIAQKKSTLGVPLYYFKEKLLTNSCSISHHGNYGAFAFTLANES